MTEFTLRSCDVQVLVDQGGDWFAVMVKQAGFRLCEVLEDLHKLLNLLGEMVEVDYHQSNSSSRKVFDAVESLWYELEGESIM